ncbi:MAG: pyridoxal-phosphate dependent enzyme, partial [Akkermansiaceae bacterium]|nr:pyridoxal-phosphate dependent enzyme [Akkermansiaceae bacterium]
MKTPVTGIWKWAKRYEAIPPAEHRLSLGEGGTPLIRSRHLGLEIGLPNLFFKLETGNPTGSYKDRFAAAAVSHMLSRDESACIATSSGNTGAALAAYCAAARIACRIAIVETAPAGKLKQMLAYGADLARIRGFGIDPKITQATFSLLKRLGSEPGHALQVSAYAISPLGMEGVESIAHELDEQLTGRIDHVFCPAGGGGLCLATARGFEKGGASPAIHCVQPEGNDTMAGPLREGNDHGRRVEPCSTAISGLQVPTVIDANETIAACRRSGGTGHLVPDDEVWH